MSRIRFGVRSVRVKTYPLSTFNISKEEAEKYGMPYDGFDIWNSDKSQTSAVPQVEKRAKYFHIMFLSFFPTSVEWTIRNKNGLVRANQACVQKIKAVFNKSYAPWYTYFAPLLVIVSLAVYMTWDYVDGQMRQRKRNNNIIANKAMLTKQLDSLPPPFYVVINRSYPSQKTFQKVDSVIDDTFYMSVLPSQIDTFKYGTEDYFYHKAFKKYKLVPTTIHRDSLLAMIPSNSEDRYYSRKQFELTALLFIAALEAPMLEFKFHLSGITINNLGKPVTLIDFTDNSEDKNNWEINTNQYIDTEHSIRAIYTPNEKKSQKTNIVLSFSDGEEFYDYKLIGTYRKLSGATYFSKDSVIQIQ